MLKPNDFRINDSLYDLLNDNLIREDDPNKYRWLIQEEYLIDTYTGVNAPIKRLSHSSIALSTFKKEILWNRWNKMDREEIIEVRWEDPFDQERYDKSAKILFEEFEKLKL
jgi:hypothetical protein